MQKLAEERLQTLASMKKLKGPYSVKIADVRTGAWRSQRPVIDRKLCIKCRICEEYCPCGVIETGDAVAIDYTYCKGCGICAEQCSRNAIFFVAEAESGKEVDK